MRLSEWRTAAPVRDSVSPKVDAVLGPVLEALARDDDPHCWVSWGDDPSARWTILVPTAAGLVLGHVRVNVPGEGPRASAKLIRWSRVQVGELAIETQSGHRILSFATENIILKGVDGDADRVAAFALALFGAIDGRVTDVQAEIASAAASRGGKGSAARSSGTARGGRAAGAAATKAAGRTTGSGPARGAAKRSPSGSGGRSA